MLKFIWNYKDSPNSQKDLNQGAGEMTWCLRTLAVVPEDLDLIKHPYGS